MKRIILSIAFVGAAVLANAQKAEVAEAKKLWNVYDLTLSGPEPQDAKKGQPRPANPNPNPGAPRPKGVGNELTKGSMDGIKDKTRTVAPSGTYREAPQEKPKPVITSYVGKQLAALYEGLKHTELATTNDKTKITAEPWTYQALFAASVAHVDTVDIANSMKYQAMAQDAIAKAKSLNPGKSDEENIAAANLILNNASRARGVAAYNRKDFKSAYDEFLALSAKDPQDTAMYINVAYMARELGNYPVAIANYQKAIDMKSKDAEAYYTEIFRMNLINLKDTAAALTTLKTASAKYPDQLDFITNEADIYLKKGDAKNADIILDKLIAKDPKNPVFLRVKADIYFNKAYDLQEVIRKLEDAKKYKEADVQIKTKSDLLNKALPLYLTIEKVDPKNVDVVTMIKQIYFALGDMPKAEEYDKKQKSLN